MKRDQTTTSECHWISKKSWVRTMWVLQQRSLTYMTHDPLHTVG